MFHFFWKVIYFLKNYIILHYVLDFKYRGTGAFVTNYANYYYAMARRNRNVQSYT